MSQAINKFAFDHIVESASIDEFAENLHQATSAGNVIERIDIDRTDVDNFAAVAVKLMQRRQWLVHANPLDHAFSALHVFLVGRRFASKFSPTVFNVTTKRFELEIIDDPSQPARIIESEGIGEYIKQSPWEEACWDTDEEELLLHLHAAHLRAFLDAGGFDPCEYHLYHGGIAALAGLSAHIHAPDFAFLTDPTCAIYTPTSASEIKTFIADWRKLTPIQRATSFKVAALAPPPERRALLSNDDFTSMVSVRAGAPVAVFMGAPFTALAATFVKRPDLASRVVLVSCMSGAWDGGQNLLGACFNNVVDYNATKATINLFPKGRFLMVPTEACKMGPFSISAEQVALLPAGSPTGEARRSALSGALEQWTELKRGVQPLFDLVPLLPIQVLARHAEIVRARVVFGTNRFALGTRYQDIGMTLESDGAERLEGASQFPVGGIFALERVFAPECRTDFIKLIENTFA